MALSIRFRSLSAQTPSSREQRVETTLDTCTNYREQTGPLITIPRSLNLPNYPSWLSFSSRMKSDSYSLNSSKKHLNSSSMASPSSPQTLTLPLDLLDHDHITSILLLLPFDSIISFALTCKRFKSLALSEPLWELICRRDWGSGTIDSFLAALSEKERREFSFRKLYEKVAVVGSLSCRRLICKGGAFPKPRASHSLNLVSDWLVLFGGGCEGGKYFSHCSYSLSLFGNIICCLN